MYKNFEKHISSRSGYIPIFCNFSKEESQLTDLQTCKKYRIIWNLFTNIPGMSSKNFRKISHSELEISLYLSNFRKEVSHIRDWETYKIFIIIPKWCNNIPWTSPKSLRMICHLDVEISLHLSNFSKEICQLTDWQTKKKFEYIWN